MAFLLLASSSLFAQTTTRDYANNVTIARDKWGVPHIYGKTDPDVAYGLAWAHAEDDFKTIEETVLMTKGMNGLINGKDGAITDFFVHAMGITRVVDAKYETDITPEFKRYLDGYAAGLSAYAAAHPKQVRIKKAFPLTGKDMIKGYTLRMILISYAHGKVEDIVKGKFDVPEVKGSNAFALAPPKTDNGNTLLCVNPHVPFEGAFSWYEAHLKSDEGMDIIGALFPGGVTVFLGTNQNLGWSHTWNGLNLTDVYRLKMNPDQKNQYWYNGKWEDLELGKAKLRVKIKKWLPRIPVGKKIYWSKFGPTFKSPNGDFYSIRFPSNMDIRAAEQWFRMNKATNKAEFMTAVKMNALCRFNIIYADKKGNVSFIDDGMIPQRDNSLDWTLPLRGDTSLYLWETWLPTYSMPQIHNPNCGWVYNTNNTPYEATCDGENIPVGTFSKNMGFRKGMNNRSLRFKALMEQYPKVGFEEMKKIKFDNSYPSTGLFIQSVMSQLDNDYGNTDLNALRDRMLKWNRTASPDDVDAPLFMICIEYIFKKKDYDDNHFRREIEIGKELFAEALAYTQANLMDHFGTTLVPLKDIQRIKRGNVEMPMPGFPDAIAANYSKQNKENGKYYGYVGDSYTMLVEYDANGPIRIESLSPFGASANPQSPHYTDQLPLFSTQQTKVMSMDWEQIKKDAERIYHPGN